MGGSDSSVMQADFVSVVSPSAVESLQDFRRVFYFIFEHLKLVDLFPDFRVRKVLDQLLKCVECNSRLHIIGSIKTIQTISPNDSSLFRYQLLKLCIEDG